MYNYKVICNVRAPINDNFFLSRQISEESESYQHLYNFKRIPEMFSDQFIKSHFFNENLKTRSHTYLTPKVGRQEDL